MTILTVARTRRSIFNKANQFDTIDVAAKTRVPSAQAGLKAEIQTAAAFHGCRGQARVRRAGAAGDQGHEWFPRYFSGVFARLRWRGAVCRQFRDREHLSITVAQRTRAGDAAHARGVAAAGIALGDARGFRDRHVASLRGWPRAGLAKGLNRCWSRSGSICPRPSPCSRPGRSSSRCWWDCDYVFAALRPALRATRVTPIAPAREGAILPPSRFHG